MFDLQSIRDVEHCTAGVLLILAFVPVGLCQTTVEQESVQASSDAMEEVIVYGDKSLVILRKEFYRAQETFFDVFNWLNSNDEFDIDCSYVVNLGSRRRHHLCQPKFARKAEVNATHDMLESGAVRAGTALPQYEFNIDRAKMRTKDDLLWEEMSTLLSEHMGLQKAFIDLAERRQLYEAKGQERRGGR